MHTSRRTKPRPIRGGSDEWVLGRRPAPFHIMEPKPHRPDLLVLMDPKVDLVVGVDVVAPETSMREAALWVEKVVAEQPGLPVRLGAPRRLRTDEASFASVLREHFGDRFEVIIGTTPEIEVVLATLTEHSRGGEEPDGLPTHGDGADQALPRFFEAAAALFRLGPWKDANDGQVLRVQAPALGWDDGCFSIIGADGESFGLVVLRSLADFMTFVRNGRDVARGRAPGVPIFSINYDDARNVPSDLVRRAREEGWEVAGKGAFPHLLKVEPDLLQAPVTVDDFRFATACLVALTRLLRKHQRLFREPLPRAVDETFTMRGLPGQATVRLVAPHPDATWRWGEETILEAIDGDDARDLGTAFETHLRESGRSDEWTDDAMFPIEQLLEFKVHYAGGGPLDWRPDHVEEFLLDYFPRKAPARDDQIDGIPDHLVAFFEWLADTDRLDPDRSARIVERIRHRRAAFLREARNPARFGPAKTVLFAMQQEGVDVTEEKAVGAFLERFNERVARDPSILPLPFDPSTNEPPAPRRAKAWVWTPGTPQPKLTGPCPCGSGQRYKKCCLPR